MSRTESGRELRSWDSVSSSLLDAFVDFRLWFVDFWLGVAKRPVMVFPLFDFCVVFWLGVSKRPVLVFPLFDFCVEFWPGVRKKLSPSSLGSEFLGLWLKRTVLETVLRIHDILGWIRIRGSMPLTNGSGSWIRILLFSALTFKMPA
jgi:hypothetical protein